MQRAGGKLPGESVIKKPDGEFCGNSMDLRPTGGTQNGSIDPAAV